MGGGRLQQCMASTIKAGGSDSPVPASQKQGLAFVFRKKAGALLSLTRERAFLVAKHVHEDGSTCWSGPVFCRGTTASLGLSAGGLELVLLFLQASAPHQLLAAQGCPLSSFAASGVRRPRLLCRLHGHAPLPGSPQRGGAGGGAAVRAVGHALPHDQSERRTKHVACSHCGRPYHTFGVTCSFLLDMNGSRLRPLHTSSGSSAAGVQVGTGLPTAGAGGACGGHCKARREKNVEAKAGRPFR